MRLGFELTNTTAEIEGRRIKKSGLYVLCQPKPIAALIQRKLRIIFIKKERFKPTQKVISTGRS